jgi:hypothetical protein
MKPLLFFERGRWYESQVDIVVVQCRAATVLWVCYSTEDRGTHEKRNGMIEGEVRQKVSTSDLIRIPPRTPTGFCSVAPRGIRCPAPSFDS